jgi:hypothetical protein
MEDAELDEPGALSALIALELAENPQFRDRAGVCKLMETALARGDQAWRSRLEGAATPDRAVRGRELP